jgi:hypothetical protein
MDDRSVLRFMENVHLFKSIKTLDLSEIGMLGEEKLALTESLKLSTTLKELNLSKCYFTEIQACCLFRAVLNNSSLEYLNLE